MSVLSMLFALIKKPFQNVSAEYMFPIRGHSFLLEDHVFDPDRTTDLQEGFHSHARGILQNSMEPWKCLHLWPRLMISRRLHRLL